MKRLALLAAVFAAPLMAADPPKMTVSGPVTHANLSVFLLHGKDTVPAGTKFLTLQEALEQKKIVVHETSDVNELSVENVSADSEVFIQSGDIVRGGKQDRLLACDLIVSPKSGQVAIPSFCCESGRWKKRGAEKDGQFESSGVQAGNKSLKLAVNASRDQGRVWDEVKMAQEKLTRNVGKPVADKQSPTSYQLTLEDKDLLAKVEAYVKAVVEAPKGKDDVVGFAIAINGKIEGVEVFGSSDLFRKLWPKLVNAAAVDALSELQKDKKFDAAKAEDVTKFMAACEAGKRSEVAVNENRGGRGQQQLRQAPNAPPNQAANPPADPTKPPPAVAEKKPSRVKNFQCDGEKTFMLECQDAKLGNAIVHRSYIAK